jgi:hypothetical protein
MAVRPPTRGLATPERALPAGGDVGGRLRELLDRADALALRAARRPGRFLLALVAVDGLLAGAFVAIGLGLGDQAALFRELTPGTLLSCLQLLAIAVVARGLHLRTAPAVSWRATFWGLCAAVFVVFAFDEITQSAIYLADALEAAFGLAPAAGFNDLEAVLLTLLFSFAALVLLPRALALRHHPRALLALAAGALLGAGSQLLDSVAPTTRWEFVAEESLKLGAEAFLLGGFLLALNDVLVRR